MPNIAYYCAQRCIFLLMYWLLQMGVLSQIFRRPRLAYYFAQKAIRHYLLRKWCTTVVTWLVNKQAPPSLQVEKSSHLQTLQTDGIVFLPTLNLNEQSVSHILEHFKNKPVCDLYTGQIISTIEKLPKEFNKVCYKIEDTLTCQPLINLANNPELLATITHYLGVTPSIASMQLWWTYGEHNATAGLHYDDVYHRDVDDLKFVKLFVYLTETTEKNGAHNYIKTSHLSRLLSRRGSISDDEVRANFSKEKFITVTGNAGTVFLEDTWGIHRPLLAIEGRRLVFYVLYNLIPVVPHGVPNPLMPLPSGLNAYINRTYFHTTSDAN